MITLEKLNLEKLISIKDDITYLNKYKSASRLLVKISDIIKKKKCELGRFIEKPYRGSMGANVIYLYINTITVTKGGKLMATCNFINHNISIDNYKIDSMKELYIEIKNNNIIILPDRLECEPVSKSIWDNVIYKMSSNG